MILCEAITATPPISWSWLGYLLGGLTGLAVAVNQMDDFFKRRQTPAGLPPNEQLQSSVDKLEERLDKVDMDVAEIRNKIDHNTEENAKAQTQRSDKLYAHIESVRTELGSKIEGMPERILAMLRNIRNLKND